MRTHNVSIPITDDEKVSGVVAIPADFQKGKTIGVILAHGAANDMENPLIVFLSNGLAEAGFLSLRFNFLYKEKGRKAPDSQKKLVQTWKEVFQFLKDYPKFGTQKIVAAGKSMGGRVACQMISCEMPTFTSCNCPCYFFPAPGTSSAIWTFCGWFWIA
jgi:predicted alpha/beta-hydrolase family hydrolase